MPFSLSTVQALWPHWPAPDRNRFFVEVLGGKPNEASPLGLLLMGINHWLIGLVPVFDESKRFYVLKTLRGQFGDQQLARHAQALARDDDAIQGFHLSVFENRWVGWTCGPVLLDMATFERVEHLPRPHIWVTILGVTPLYFRLINDLEEMENAEHEAPRGERPPENHPQ